MSGKPPEPDSVAILPKTPREMAAYVIGSTYISQLDGLRALSVVAGLWGTQLTEHETRLLAEVYNAALGHDADTDTTRARLDTGPRPKPTYHRDSRGRWSR
jgi:hypothetical protein